MIRQHDNGIDNESVVATRPLHRIAQGIDAFDKQGVSTLKKVDRKEPAPPIRMRDGNWASQHASNILEGGIRCRYSALRAARLTKLRKCRTTVEGSPRRDAMFSTAFG